MTPEDAARRAAAWLVPGTLVVVALVVVLLARSLRDTAGVAAFIAQNPGAAPLPAGAPVGFPAWLAWQHGLNAVFLLFTVRSGWRIHRGERPSTFWARRNGGVLATRTPPIRIAIDLWAHYVADSLWVLNGAIYLVLLFATGQWQRIVPLDWSILPAALSTALQYASLDWPTTNGWIDYNALQSLSYFVVVFLAGPVAVATGLRLSPGFAAALRPLDRVLPLRAVKRVHFWTMVFLVAFTAVHVLLVLATGALRNLNHMYAVRDDGSPVGLLVFAGSVLVTAALVFALRPSVVSRLASLTGTVTERPQRRPVRSSVSTAASIAASGGGGARRRPR